MSLDLESELREQLARDDPRNKSSAILSEGVLAVIKKVGNPPEISTPCLLAVYSMYRSLVAPLCDAVAVHYTGFSEASILPVIFRYLKSRKEAVALECLAYCKYEHGSPEISGKDVVISDAGTFDFREELKSGQQSSTASRLFHWPAGCETRSIIEHDSRSLPTWVVKWLVLNENRSKTVVNEWWSFVIPSLLNSLHTANVPRKANAVKLVDTLIQAHGSLLSSTGLIGAFAEAVEQCLSFLPPMSSPAETMQIHRPAIECLSKLAQKLDTEKNSRLNFIAREGCLKPFFHTQENVELTIYFFQNLERFVDVYLQSLTAVHLHGVVKVFNQTMCDPFVDYSPKLIEAACNAMAASIKWSWPRVHEYQYTIALGLAKANALDTECFRLLELPENEIAILGQYTEDHRRTELGA